jgi:hypothetical protein
MGRAGCCEAEKIMLHIRIKKADQNRSAFLSYYFNQMAANLSPTLSQFTTFQNASRYAGRLF